MNFIVGGHGIFLFTPAELLPEQDDKRACKKVARQKAYEACKEQARILRKDHDLFDRMEDLEKFLHSFQYYKWPVSEGKRVALRAQWRDIYDRAYQYLRCRNIRSWR